MKLFGKILLKGLALLYFAMAIVGFLGYFGLETFSVSVFSFFQAFMGKYALILPVICLVFTMICWRISVTENTEEDYYEDGDQDIDEVELSHQKPKQTQHKRREIQESRMKKSRKKLKPDDYSQLAGNDHGFTGYFSGTLHVNDNQKTIDNMHENLGTNFSTYFGQGSKNIYLPPKMVDLNGFKDYFRNKSAQRKEFDKAANDIFQRMTIMEAESMIAPAKQVMPSRIYPPKEPIVLEKLQKKESPEIRKIESVDCIEKVPEHPTDKGWILPEINLLHPREKIEVRNEQQNPKLLEDVLSTFGVTAKVVNISTGPVTTRYELSPAPGTKISKIVNLADDIALALASRDIRIEAPIPGKAAIGIEIPRKNPRTVYFREVIDSEAFVHSKSKLKVALGKDIADSSTVGELERMPHLLVAGATGSGKSIFINCLINSLLYTVTPEEVRLLLIDPKMVELNLYNGIPHLLTPVVTDPKKANKYLRYIVKEMENRYELFASSGVRDIDHYNKSAENKKLPYIVVIIDELADLMMVASNEIEESICRLAQMARAAGIHLVIATQRPSVNVITGLIKANIPSRISFAVSSQIDSRTILDAGGAEKLLGKGDMLYSPIGLNKPLRIHGCFIDEQEVKKVIEHWKKQGRPEFGISEEHLEESVSAEKKDEDFDDKFLAAAELVITTGIASVSFLQRRLRVGYSRAARLMDMLEEAGVVGSHEGNKPRDILMSMEVFNNSYCS